MIVRRKPQKSLRTILIGWFLVFSLVPLTFITGYSLRTYEVAINNEVKQRLRANAREISTIIAEYQKFLVSNSVAHLADPGLPYYLSTNNFQAARRLAFQWMNARTADRISLFNREGCFLTSVFHGDNGEPQSVPNVESGNICADESFLKNTVGHDQILLVEATNQKTMDLVVFTVVRNRKNETAGYMEQVIILNENMLETLKKRMNLELAVVDSTGQVITSSHPDLMMLPKDTFKDDLPKAGEGFRDMSIRDLPYSFFLKPVKWDKQQFYMALGASKSSTNATLQNISLALLIVGLVVIVLLVFLSIISSRMILRPLNVLVEAIQEMDQGDKPIEVVVQGNNEISVLTQSFNDMSQRIAQTRTELRAKIRELESAYRELKDTQARLVHSAKMASLGQLVAGVAHELNNPIGFIYSNMSHLRDYSDRLVRLLDTAEKHPDQLTQQKDELEYNYILEDLPRLIKSCEEGAKRTRDIVLGLRNFSRLEEAKVKKVDIREGIENTLQLLAGDIKSRIEVITDFKPTPQVMCYPSQLNQVFMNILANAVQAIDGEGQIHIVVEPQKAKGREEVRIAIRDSGRGMTAEVAEKIFDPFFTTKTVGQGTGLGLSISYGIIKNHNGDILVSSDPGHGTEFVIILPVNGVSET